jgi:hypothetical protein
MNPHINERSRVLPPWGHLMTASRIAFGQQPPISRCVAKVEPKVVPLGCIWLTVGRFGHLSTYDI